MKTTNSIKILMLILISQSAWAADCDATRFPFSVQQSDTDLRALFDQTPRAQLESYYFFEVSEPKSGNRSIGVKLGEYLMATEQNEAMEGFYGLLQEAAGFDSSSEKGHAIQLKTICKMRDAMRSYMPARNPARTNKKPQKG